MVPTPVVDAAPRDGQWGKVRFNAIPNFASYRGAWHLIRDRIGLGVPEEPEEEAEA